MTFKNFLLFIITITLSMNSVMSILGGVKQTDVRKCRQLLSKIDLGVDSYLRKYVIVSCTEQLVSGKKYTMTVRPTLTSDVHVDIEIWAKLDQTFEITVGEETAENVKNLSNLRVDSEELFTEIVKLLLPQLIYKPQIIFSHTSSLVVIQKLLPVKSSK